MHVYLFMELPQGVIINKSCISKVIETDSGVTLQTENPIRSIDVQVPIEKIKKDLTGFNPEFDLKNPET